VLVGAQAVGRIAPLPRKTGDADFAVLVEDWAHLDRFFAACQPWCTDLDRKDLKMRHKATSVRVDVIPCGGIERPPGTLVLRGTERVFDNTGVVECFAVSEPFAPDLPTVLVPPACALVLLKLFAWSDRRAGKDLRDLGHLLRHAPRDDDAMYEDAPFLQALSADAVDYDDWRAWQTGRSVVEMFTPTTVDRVRSVLADLGVQPDGTRADLIVSEVYGGLATRLAEADRLTEGLRCGLR
jgi:predicted nucleotidyltransferase